MTGIFMTDLGDILRAAGLPCIDVPGAKTRGTFYRGGQRACNGLVCHHTATRDSLPGDYPTLRWIIEGGPTLPPPVANLGLGRSGTWYFCAAGRANHAGPVYDRYRTTYGNGYSIGIEAEHSGYGPWPKEQYDSYARGVAAITLAKNIPFEAHKNIRPGKPDPSFDWAQFRRDVAEQKELLKGKTNRDDALWTGLSPAKTRELQAWFIRRYAWARAILVPAGGADGLYGPATRATVSAYQRRMNYQAKRQGWSGWTELVVDGKWGPKTRGAAARYSNFED